MCECEFVDPSLTTVRACRLIELSHDPLDRLDEPLAENAKSSMSTAAKLAQNGCVSSFFGNLLRRLVETKQQESEMND